MTNYGCDTVYVDPTGTNSANTYLTIEDAKKAHIPGRGLIVRYGSALVCYLEQDGTPFMQEFLNNAFLDYRSRT